MKTLLEVEVRALLSACRIGRLGCVDNGEPYVVPISYVFEDGSVYSHSLPGRKIEALRANPRACLQVDEIELQAVGRYESVSFYFQNYLRGQAYLGERNGAEAAREFHTILDHRGWSPLSPLYPLAHLRMARAATLAGDTAKARKSYQDFLALWKDADADLPILIEAKKENEKLK